MKEQTIRKFLKTAERESPEGDVFIVTRDADGNISVSVSGSMRNIAQALFATLHNPNNTEMADQLYTMVKSITCSIIRDTTSRSGDLLGAIGDACSFADGDGECAHKKALVVPMFPNKKQDE